MKNYVIEYQTEEEAIKDMHSTSFKMLGVLIVLSGILYLFN
jgi:hypothetical protein